MLKARYVDTTLVPDEPVNLPDGAPVVLQVLQEPPNGLLGTLRLDKIRAVYKRGVFVLPRHLSIGEGVAINIVTLSRVRSLDSFQGMLQHLEEDGVALQHRAREWWGHRAN